MLKRTFNIFGIFLAMILLFSLTGCSEDKYVVVEDYNLGSEEIVVDNVIYNDSSFGWVATELEDEDVEEVTIHSYINNKEVYAVAEGFLDGNKDVEVLNLSNGNILYEKNCVINCPNLKEINLKQIDNYISQALNLLCEKNAFVLEDDCYFYVYYVEAIEHYIYGMNDYVDKFKLLDTVYLYVYAKATITNMDNFTIKSSSVGFTVEGKAFGIIDLNINRSDDEMSESFKTELIEDDDFFIKNHRKVKFTEIKYTLRASATIERKIMWQVYKDYSVGCSDSFETLGLTGMNACGSGDKPHISVSLDRMYSYNSNYR